MDDFLLLCGLIWDFYISKGDDRSFSNHLKILKTDFFLIIRDHLNHFPDLLFGIGLSNILQKEDYIILSNVLVLIYINHFKGLNDFFFAEWCFANLVSGDILFERDLLCLYFGFVLLVLAQVELVIVFLDLGFAWNVALVDALVYEIVWSFDFDLVFTLVILLLLLVKYSRKRCWWDVWCVGYVWYRKWYVQTFLWHFFKSKKFIFKLRSNLWQYKQTISRLDICGKNEKQIE